MSRDPSTIVLVRIGDVLDRAVQTDLAGANLSVVVAEDAQSGLRALDEVPADLLIMEAGQELASTLGLLREVQARWPGMPVVLICDELLPPELAEAVGLGAHDILMRPVDVRQLLLAIQKARISASRGLAAPPPPRAETGMIFGRSSAMRAVKELLEQVAPTTSTVLVRGESGTGKELVARAVHRLSQRAERPFIKIDCTSLPENLMESELFGYEKGAFTGAAQRKLGRVQLADGGTLFFDEVGELAPALQAKLLRLLQDREFERLGGQETLAVDVRVVAATHRDLERMVDHGEFRQDLFYRLNVVPLWLAPLRARRADVADLARHFCAEAAAGIGKSKPEFDSGALDALSSQRWPGNARQLQNFVERLVVLAKSSLITEADVQAELARPVRFETETGSAGADAAEDLANGGVLLLSDAVRAAERQALLRALEHAGGNRSAAARLLGVSRSALYKKLEEYALL